MTAPVPSGTQPATHFLPAERATAEELQRELARAAGSPVVDVLLETWGGSMALLDRHRQIIAVNNAYLDLLGVAEPAAVLGLRPGEAIHCVHSADHAGGCGTGLACITCGAAIAIVTAMSREQPCERECALAARRDGGVLELDLLVRASPLKVDGQGFVLLTLADVSAEKRRASLERAFFHDLSNVVAGLCGVSEGLEALPPDELHDAAHDVQALAGRLSREIQVQRTLSDGRGGYNARVERIPLAAVAESMRALFQHHPAAAGRTLELGPASGELWNDSFLLQRVLTNMLVNAFEASPPGGVVRLDFLGDEDGLTFRVWNAGHIPAPVAERIFQRYFSTKAGAARGHGTYVIKLFGEQLMGGQVGFTTTAEAGTTFTVRLPWRR